MNPAADSVNRFTLGRAALARIFEQLHASHDQPSPTCRLCKEESSK